MLGGFDVRNIEGSKTPKASLKSNIMSLFF